MGTKPFAAVIGDINIDIITPPFDPEILQHGETSCVLDEFTMSLGGNAINVAGALAALNDPHVFLGGMGTCAISEWIKKQCQQLKIKTKFGVLEGKSAGITFALTYTGGRRQFVATLGTNKLITMDKLDLSVLKTTTHLHRAGFWYTAKLKGEPTIRVFKGMIQNGNQTSLDVGWDPENFSDDSQEILYKTLEYTSIFFGNEKEFKAITRKTKIEDAYHELLGISKSIVDPILVVHQGEHGCTIVRKQGIVQVPAYSISKLINPTGSGDVFNGAFIHGILNGWSLEQSARFAAKSAAVHISDITKIYPTLEDIGNY
jgi:sugar/nucleoside kinase (ribokinase family)